MPLTGGARGGGQVRRLPARQNMGVVRFRVPGDQSPQAAFPIDAGDEVVQPRFGTPFFLDASPIQLDIQLGARFGTRLGLEEAVPLQFRQQQVELRLGDVQHPDFIVAGFGK